MVSVHPPGRDIAPGFERFSGPVGGFVRVAARTGVGDLELIRQLRRNEFECMASDVDVGNFLFDFRHVAGDTLASSASDRMMSMRFDC